MVTTTDDAVVSEVRKPVNLYLALDHSIHNDEVAKPLGLRGGTIAGSVHMDQFPPVLLEAFGQQWFETGSLSLKFENPTTHLEPVQVMIDRPERSADVQVGARVVRDDGLLVASGTASVGSHDAPSHLDAIDQRPVTDGSLRMFEDLVVGDVLVQHTGSVSSEEAREREAAGNITEPLPWYVGDSPWGGPIASPSAAVRMLYRPTSERISRTTGGAVGLFGAIEIRHVAGPLLADTEYSIESRLVSVGGSPRTEYAWFDSAATAADGTTVATMRMQLRYMKKSSSLFEEDV